MGFYSNVKVRLIGGTEKSREAIKAAIHRKYILDDPDAEGTFTFETNHYWQRDPEFFAKLSTRYPDVIIELKKDSGEHGLEAFRFKDGEVEICDGEIVFEPFEDILTDKERQDRKRMERKRVSTLFDEALQALNEIRTCGYWPYASPAPCSTEVALRNCLDASIRKLEDAIFLHKQLYHHPGTSPMEPPCVTVQQIH